MRDAFGMQIFQMNWALTHLWNISTMKFRLRDVLVSLAHIFMCSLAEPRFYNFFGSFWIGSWICWKVLRFSLCRNYMLMDALCSHCFAITQRQMVVNWRAFIAFLQITFEAFTLVFLIRFSTSSSPKSNVYNQSSLIFCFLSKPVFSSRWSCSDFDFCLIFIALKIPNKNFVTFSAIFAQTH